MSDQLTALDLRRQSAEYSGTGGASEGNAALGFQPAYLDSDTGEVFQSRYSDGRPASLHLLEGLPERVVIERDAEGKVVAVKPSLVPGFVHQGSFYSREQALRAVEQLQADANPH